MFVSTRIPSAFGVVLLVAVTGCDSGSPPPTGPAAFTPKPEAIADAKRRDVGAICPIERVNGEMVRSMPPLRAGTLVTLSGWSRVADPADPVPSVVHVVLRPAGSKGATDLFLQAQREKRPDLAGEPGMSMAGFLATGQLPATPGRYQVLVLQGTATWQVECDTGQMASLE